MAEDSWAAMRGFTRETMAKHAIPAVALAVAEEGTEVFAEGFGVREVGAGGEITPDSIFGVASVTKGFTALAIMQLAEAGKLSVDDLVVRYLPGYRTPDAMGTSATTIHHFLTHTAGLPPLASRFFALARAARTIPSPHPAPRGSPSMRRSIPPMICWPISRGWILRRLVRRVSVSATATRGLRCSGRSWSGSAGNTT